MIVSALDDIENLISTKQDVEDLSPYSDYLLSFIYPAKEHLFRYLSTRRLAPAPFSFMQVRIGLVMQSTVHALQALL